MRTRPVDRTGLATRLWHTTRHDPEIPSTLGRALEGVPIAAHASESDHGVVSVLFTSRWPFHPARLHTALEHPASEALRARGQLWLASQPDTAIGFESVGGGLGMGRLGYWLAALPQQWRAEAKDHRCIAADLDGDLAFIGIGLDP